MPFTVTASSQVCTNTDEFVYFGGAISANRNINIEATRRILRAWACFGRHKMEICDGPGVCLRLKVRLLNRGAPHATVLMHHVEPEIS